MKNSKRKVQNSIPGLHTTAILMLCLLILLMSSCSSTKSRPAPKLPEEAPQPTLQERRIVALVRIDLHLLVDYGFSPELWPVIGVERWPLVDACLSASTLSAFLTTMEEALNREDPTTALSAAGKAAAEAARVGLYASAADIAEMVLHYAEKTGHADMGLQMNNLIRGLAGLLADSPEFKAEGVSTEFLTLKPNTLFVGDLESVRALGLPEIEVRFVNMLEILAARMVHQPNLTSCPCQYAVPDHLFHDFWIEVQRLRIYAAALACSISQAELEPVVDAVPSFNGSWGLASCQTLGTECSVLGTWPIWGGFKPQDTNQRN